MSKFRSIGKGGKKQVEAGKNLLIVLLVIVGLLLLGKIGLFQELSDMTAVGKVFSLNGEAVETEVSGTITAAASPFCIVVTPEAGVHCAIMYDAEALSTAYGQFSASLGQALGSSGAPVEVSAAEWESALSGCGVYFDFMSDQRLSVLAGWLGVEMTSSAGLNTARRLCLVKDGTGVALYYIRVRGDAAGTAYRCETALSYMAISEKVENYVPDGTDFNFELDSPFSMVDRDTIINKEQLSIVSVTSGNPLSGASDYDELMSTFGMSSLLAYPYTEADGAEVFVEGDSTMRIDPNGTVMFIWTGQSDQGVELEIAQAIEIARAACQKTIGANCGEAKLYLSYIFYDSELNEYTVRFDYSINGLPVSFADGSSAAEVRLTDGRITAASIRYREYTSTDSAEYPLPALQAAAVVQASGGGEPILSYTDDLVSVNVNWVIK